MVEKRAPLTVLLLAVCVEVFLPAALALDFANPTVVKRGAMSRDTKEVGHRALFIHHHLEATSSSQIVGKVHLRVVIKRLDLTYGTKA